MATDNNNETNMMQDAAENAANTGYATRRQHRKPEDKRGQYFMIRQILNIVFILTAVIGCIIYSTKNEMMGGILIVIAITFKMAESVLRLRKSK